MIKVTQADIEDVINYAAERGITILEIGMSPAQLKEYNKASLSAKAIVLSFDLAEKIEQDSTNPKFRGGVLITTMKDSK